MNCQNFDKLMVMRKYRILEVMDMALDRMQQHNGRTKTECVEYAIEAYTPEIKRKRK